LNELKKWFLKEERSYLRLSLDRLDRITGYIVEIEMGHGIMNKIKRLHTLPTLRSEQKYLRGRQDEFQLKLQDIEWKLRNID